MIVKNDLYDYENRYIYQDSEAFKFSLDSILLAEFCDINDKSKQVLDMCSGNGAIMLILSTKIKSKLIGFEIQKEIADLAQKSIDCNQLDDSVKMINDDINNISKYFTKEEFDAIVCNPPFFKVNDKKCINDNIKKSIARHEIYINLEDIFKLAKDYLKNNASLYLVHRSTRLDELIILGNKYKINVKKIQFISTHKGKDPSIVLIKCVKNSMPGIITKSEICIENCVTYKNIFKESK